MPAGASCSEAGASCSMAQNVRRLFADTGDDDAVDADSAPSTAESGIGGDGERCPPVGSSIHRAVPVLPDDCDPKA